MRWLSYVLWRWGDWFSEQFEFWECPDSFLLLEIQTFSVVWWVCLWRTLWCFSFKIINGSVCILYIQISIIILLRLFHTLYQSYFIYKLSLFFSAYFLSPMLIFAFAIRSTKLISHSNMGNTSSSFMLITILTAIGYRLNLFSSLMYTSFTFFPCFFHKFAYFSLYRKYLTC